MSRLPPQHWGREAENHNHQEPFFIFCNEIWEDHLQSVSLPGREGATLYANSGFPQKENLDEAIRWHLPSVLHTCPTRATHHLLPVVHKAQPIPWAVILCRPHFHLDSWGCSFPDTLCQQAGFPEFSCFSFLPHIRLLRGSVTPPTHGSPRLASFLSHDAPHTPYFLFASLLRLEKL